jgi:thiamine-monophosphate kinase
MMDVSDGLALDLSRIAEASEVRIDLDRVPVHRDARRLARTSGRSAREHALHDGEDHELLATVDRAAGDRLLATARGRFPGLWAIGVVREGRGLWIRDADDAGRPRRWSGKGGWSHGR